MTITLADIQRRVGVVPDGVIGPRTLAAIWDALPPATEPPATKRTSNAGLDLIREFEGLKLVAYRDTGGVLTIGYGHTGPDVKPGMTITEAAAVELLREDVREAEADVAKLCPITTQNQFDALVSFAFNLGGGQLKESTLRRLHNEGDYAKAKLEFGRWVFDNGVRLRGLERRRAAEAKLYGAEA